MERPQVKKGPVSRSERVRAISRLIAREVKEMRQEDYYKALDAYNSQTVDGVINNEQRAK